MNFCVTPLEQLLFLVNNTPTFFEDQSSSFNAKRSTELAEYHYRWIAHSTFYATDISPVYAGGESKILL